MSFIYEYMSIDLLVSKMTNMYIYESLFITQTNY